MLRFFNRLLIALILIGLAVLLTLSNSEPAVLRLGRGLEISTYAGVIYLGIFASGCVAASLVGLYFGLRWYLKERRFKAAERARQAFYQLLVKARALMASHEWAKSRDLWEQIIKQDPDNVIARVELSNCYQSMGEPKEALRVLDASRASSKRSVEVLFRAAELNRHLGNDTAASDNIAILLTENPSRRALEMGRDIAEQLGRIDDAIELQSELSKLSYESTDSSEARTRLAFKRIVLDAPDQTTLRETLLTFTKKHPHYLDALQKLVELESTTGSVESCADALVKLAKSTPVNIAGWEQVVEFWLSNSGKSQSQSVATKQTDRAVAAAKSAAQECQGMSRIHAELLLAKTYLAINRIEDANRTLEALPALCEREHVVLDLQTERLALSLKGAALAQRGLGSETTFLWQQLVDSYAMKTNLSRTGVNGASKFNRHQELSEPSLLLSTP